MGIYNDQMLAGIGAQQPAGGGGAGGELAALMQMLKMNPQYANMPGMTQLMKEFQNRADPGAATIFGGGQQQGYMNPNMNIPGAMNMPGPETAGQGMNEAMWQGGSPSPIQPPPNPGTTNIPPGWTGGFSTGLADTVGGGLTRNWGGREPLSQQPPQTGVLPGVGGPAQPQPFGGGYNPNPQNWLTNFMQNQGNAMQPMQNLQGGMQKPLYQGPAQQPQQPQMPPPMPMAQQPQQQPMQPPPQAAPGEVTMVGNQSYAQPQAGPKPGEWRPPTETDNGWGFAAIYGPNYRGGL